MDSKKVNEIIEGKIKELEQEVKDNEQELKGRDSYSGSDVETFHNIVIANEKIELLIELQDQIEELE